MGSALPGFARSYKTPGAKLRPRYPAEYAMTGAKNAHELRVLLGESGIPNRRYAVAKRFQKLAVKYDRVERYSRESFLKLPRAARKILNEVWAAQVEWAEDRAYGGYR